MTLAAFAKVRFSRLAETTDASPFGDTGTQAPVPPPVRDGKDYDFALVTPAAANVPGVPAFRPSADAIVAPGAREGSALPRRSPAKRAQRVALAGAKRVQGGGCDGCNDHAGDVKKGDVTQAQ